MGNSRPDPCLAIDDDGALRSAMVDDNELNPRPIVRRRGRRTWMLADDLKRSSPSTPSPLKRRSRQPKTMLTEPRRATLAVRTRPRRPSAISTAIHNRRSLWKAACPGQGQRRSSASVGAAARIPCDVPDALAQSCAQIASRGGRTRCGWIASAEERRRADGATRQNPMPFFSTTTTTHRIRPLLKPLPTGSWTAACFEDRVSGCRAYGCVETYRLQHALSADRRMRRLDTKVPRQMPLHSAGRQRSGAVG
ncbi:hypothetical protein BJ912DRAFT_65493 [Pholiota molesta]|nr:hypothetical protein BJ912DRAFT_65468 [Pholiota molesta]KAF8174222.1 hypothetical protein BJ912DRAFT_65493 [Pholiota molesta]